MSNNNKSKLTYVITGGCGFLGQHLLRVLLEKEKNVKEIRLFDKNVFPSLQSESTEDVKVVIIQGDITKYEDVRNAFLGADLVFHAASLVDVWYKIPEKVIFAVNVQGTENAIKACVEIGIQYLVYTSSMEVVGPNVKGDEFVRGNEDTPYNIFHEMPYPKSKAAAEKIVLEANGTKVEGGNILYTCCLRPTGIYGEQHQLMKDFYLNSVRNGGWVMRGVPPHTEHGRVYAGNVAWMHLLAARALQEHPNRLGGECYFCYDDSPYKPYDEFNMQFLSAFNFRSLRLPVWMLWIIAWMNDMVRWVLKPIYNYTPLLNKYTLAVACTSFTVSTDKAFRHFQYQPLYSWQQCLSRTQSWVNTFPFETSTKDK
uniref:3 beta-hydroxysteroid dehydrogenase type 7 isoform X1 n=1 Tax=Danio rerio TaxID=7955 RepID=F1QEV3_DANRE|nr:3 beta-hydroxysteroid dehydrogenase type 7 isoform X1 [Danio rerio]XP_009297794.1 3 beta-hydroxysteroid dehydrogenase type 7 isoform X1 [Danio rerio]XP_017208926.1 3 beta-hydroxysteroid dehydrogenase type 7 isoform X1 [Danio rerio]|eukprot:XP_009297793.1 3 beta-hydroxysteroid dehydrogenase type 7 isoform X1 [Danio rerio]